MPFQPRVRWHIQCSSQGAATGLSQAIAAVLSGKTPARIAEANRRQASSVLGDYLFGSAADATAVHAIAKLQLETAADSGYAEIHDCDHDSDEKATEGGCKPPTRTER